MAAAGMIRGPQAREEEVGKRVVRAVLLETTCHPGLSTLSLLLRLPRTALLLYQADAC